MTKDDDTRRSLPRKLATRRKLIAAAQTLFLDQGYARVVVSDIPKLAGVSQGTFYNHFADKLDVFLEFAHEVCVDLDDYVANKIKATPTEWEAYVSELLNAVGVYALRHPSLLTTVMVDVNTLGPENLTDPRLPDIRWSNNWANILVGAKGDEGREPTFDELMVGYTIQYIVRSTFAFSLQQGFTGQAVVDRTIAHVKRIIQPELERETRLLPSNKSTPLRQTMMTTFGAAGL